MSRSTPSSQGVDETTVSKYRYEKHHNVLLESLAAEFSSLRHELNDKDTEILCLRNELQSTRTKLDKLEAHNRELKAAQVYHTKVDMLSGAEVISLIDALNAEILQTAASISDSFGFAHDLANADERTDVRGNVREFMGPTLARLLRAVVHSKDPLLVQIALQGAMVKLSRRIIMSWDFGDVGGQQAKYSLAEIYDEICESETQAVASRWRVLTRAHVQRLARRDVDIHATLAARVSGILVAILVAAGCTKSYEEAYSILTQRFREHISKIVEMAVHLNRAMGEEVVSADLWPFYVASGKEFNPAFMSDFESLGEGSEGKTVLCTTALGLLRSERVVQGGTVKFERAALLKPQVTLGSVADALERLSEHS